jgi:hypothetical protein
MSRQIPGILWVGLITLAVITVIQLFIAIAGPQPALLIGLVLQVATLYGLYAGHRWAYVVVLVCAVLGVLVMSMKSAQAGVAVLVINGIVVVPVLLSTEYYFGRRRADAYEPRFCPTCGHSLLGLAEPRCPECGREFGSPGIR